MSLPTDFLNAQDMPVQRVPVTFSYLEVGGYGDAAAPGRWFPLLSDVDGALFVTLIGPGGLPILLPDNADGVAPVATNTRLPTVARLYVYDDDQNEFNRARAGDDSVDSTGTLGPNIVATDSRPRLWQNTTSGWIRARANDNITVLASAARTATLSSATFNNGNYRGASFIIDVTAITATPSVVFSIEGLDAVSGQFYTLLDSVAIVAVGTTVITVYPGLTPLANIDASALLPWQWRVTATHDDADSITYSVGANLMM